MIAGIVADNYKVEKFKKELSKSNFTIKKIVPFTLVTSTIQVEYEQKQLEELTKICKLVELHFKRGN